MLGLLVVPVDEVADGLSVANGLGLTVGLDGDQGDVVLNSSGNLLGVEETSVDAFLLGDLQDGEVLTALTASKDAGNQGTSPERTSSVVTSVVVKARGGRVGEDGLLGAGGEVDGLDDLVDLVVLLAILLESLGPSLFSRALLAAFGRGGLLGLGAGARGGAGLSLLLELVGVVEGSILADGVVSLAFTMDGLLTGLPEETRLLVGFLSVARGSLAVQVALDQGVLASGVDGEERSNGLLNVLSPDGSSLRDLDGLNDSFLEDDFHGGFKVLQSILGQLLVLTLLNLTLSPSSGEFLVNLGSLKLFSLDIDGVLSGGGQEQSVIKFKSGLLVIDFSN